MIPRRYGRIINIGSIAALRGSTGDFTAVALQRQQGGLVSLTRALGANGALTASS